MIDSKSLNETPPSPLMATNLSDLLNALVSSRCRPLGAPFSAHVSAVSRDLPCDLTMTLEVFPEEHHGDGSRDSR